MDLPPRGPQRRIGGAGHEIGVPVGDGEALPQRFDRLAQYRQAEDQPLHGARRTASAGPASRPIAIGRRRGLKRTANLFDFRRRIALKLLGAPRSL